LHRGNSHGARDELRDSLQKSPSLPELLQPVFRCIDKKDFEALGRFFRDDFRLYFAHYTLLGIKQGIGFVGAFDRRLPKQEHVINDIYVGEHLTYFDGTLRVWLPDDTIIETPFWDKIAVDPDTGKIGAMYAIFSIAAVPEAYWKDLKPEDIA
jgi:hypothetical protein